MGPCSRREGRLIALRIRAESGAGTGKSLNRCLNYATQPWLLQEDGSDHDSSDSVAGLQRSLATDNPVSRFCMLVFAAANCRRMIKGQAEPDLV